jgi:hypothetical protein
MFKITHITFKRFSLAEILLMLAINQVEATSGTMRLSGPGSNPSVRSRP